MTSKKGLVFGDTFMALIIGTVVVIMIVTGTSISYQNLACYTGLKWFMESPGPHVGTIANSKVSITSPGPEMINFTACNKTCFDKYTDCIASKEASDKQGVPTCDPADCQQGIHSCTTDENNVQTCQEINCYVTNQICIASCSIKYPDLTADYVFFRLTVGYSGTVPSKLNISEYYEGTDKPISLFWYGKTGVMEDGDSVNIITKPFKLEQVNQLSQGMSSLFSKPNTVIFNGTAIDKGWIAPAEQTFELKINDIYYSMVK
jgi:hypothetical protein